MIVDEYMPSSSREPHAHTKYLSSAWRMLLGIAGLATYVGAHGYEVETHAILSRRSLLSAESILMVPTVLDDLNIDVNARFPDSIGEGFLRDIPGLVGFGAAHEDQNDLRESGAAQRH
jgi:hypothetical protein